MDLYRSSKIQKFFTKDDVFLKTDSQANKNGKQKDPPPIVSNNLLIQGNKKLKSQTIMMIA